MRYICAKKYQKFIDLYTFQPGAGLPVLPGSTALFMPIAPKYIKTGALLSITIVVAGSTVHKNYDTFTDKYHLIADKYNLWEDSKGFKEGINGPINIIENNRINISSSHKCRFIDNGFSKEHYCYFDGCDKSEMGGI